MMRPLPHPRRLLALATLALLLALPRPGGAYTCDGGGGLKLHWPQDDQTGQTPVTFTYDPSIPVAFKTQIDSCFRDPNAGPDPDPWTWARYSNLAIQSQTGVTMPVGLNNPPVNQITYDNTPDNLALLGDAAAMTIVYSNDQGEILDTDIILNPNRAFDQPGKLPLRPTILHEIGHALGLAHSAVLTSAMFPYRTQGDTSDAFSRDYLDYDDNSAIIDLYPNDLALRETGVITGTVRNTYNQLVYGAQVVAVSANNGLVFGADLSKGSNQGDLNGTFEIHGLPLGDYYLYAEPNDGPTTQNDWDGNYAAGSYWGGNFTKRFQTALAREIDGSLTRVHINARHPVNSAQITVPAVDPTMNPLRASLQADDPDPHPPRVVRLTPGETKTVYIFGQSSGPSGAVMDLDVSSVSILSIYQDPPPPPQFVVSNIFTAKLADGTPYVRFEVTVNKVLHMFGGPRALVLTKSSGEEAILTGGLYLNALQDGDNLYGGWFSGVKDWTAYE